MRATSVWLRAAVSFLNGPLARLSVSPRSRRRLAFFALIRLASIACHSLIELLSYPSRWRTTLCLLFAQCAKKSSNRSRG